MKMTLGCILAMGERACRGPHVPGVGCHRAERTPHAAAAVSLAGRSARPAWQLGLCVSRRSWVWHVLPLQAGWHQAAAR